MPIISVWVPVKITGVEPKYRAIFYFFDSVTLDKIKSHTKKIRYDNKSRRSVK